MGWQSEKSRGNVIASYRSARSQIYKCNLNMPDGSQRYWTSLSIINESLISSIRIRVNNLTIRILPRGTFDDDFEPFTQVEILNNVTHSIVMRG